MQQYAEKPLIGLQAIAEQIAKRYESLSAGIRKAVEERLPYAKSFGLIRGREIYNIITGAERKMAQTGQDDAQEITDLIQNNGFVALPKETKTQVIDHRITVNEKRSYKPDEMDTAYELAEMPGPPLTAAKKDDRILFYGLPYGHLGAVPLSVILDQKE